MTLIFCLTGYGYISIHFMQAPVTRLSVRLELWSKWLGEVAIWLGILPLFVLCWYAHPSADDFLQANDVSKHGHWGYLRYMYLHWTGRYTAMIGWSFLNPVSYGQTQEGYGLVCFLLLLLLLGTLVLLVKTLVQGAGLTARQLWLAGASALLLIVYYLPSTAEYFYWLTGGGFNYLLPGILLLLALAALVTAVRVALPYRRYYLGAVAGLLFLAVGCNETIALPIVLTVWGIVLVESRRQQRLVGVGIALSVTIGCAVSFLAPGNAARAIEERAVSPGLLTSALSAIKFTVYCLINWLGNGVLPVVTVLLVPAFARLAQRPELPLNQLARHPLLLTLLIPAFLTAGFFPSFWVSNRTAPPRAENLLYLCFVVAWVLAAYSWVLYYVKTHTPSSSLRLPAFARWLLIAWLPVTFLTDYNHHLRNPGYRLSTNNSLLAYRDLLHGTAARYDAQLMARYRYLRSNASPHAQVAPLSNPSLTLLFSDITPDTADWANRAYAEFFNKQTIVIQTDISGK